MKPLVTLVILAYNQEQYIEEAMEGAFKQDYPNLEIIISDDGSNDRTWELILSYISSHNCKHTVRTNLNQENLGFAEHINEVLSIANGKFIVWCAGDDISLEGKVSKLVEPMLLNEKISAVQSAVIEIDLDGNEIGSRNINYLKEENDNIISIIEKGLSVRSQSHAFRKKVFDYFGPLDPIVTNEGKVMAFREKLFGDIYYLDEPLTLYRIGSGVSTYSGRDVKKLTFDEPLKIVNWRLTALLQIEKDYEKADKDFKYPDSLRVKKLIKKEIRKSRIRAGVIQEKWNWKMLIASLKFKGLFKRCLVDFSKRNISLPVLKKFYR